MDNFDVLSELINRLTENKKKPTAIYQSEIDLWPPNQTKALLKTSILSAPSLAKKAICTGCEEACLRPIQKFQTKENYYSAFMFCHLRDDTYRIQIKENEIKYRSLTLYSLAEFIRLALDIKGEVYESAEPNKLSIGIFKGSVSAAHISLIYEDEIYLQIGQNYVLVNETLFIKNQTVRLDKKRLVNIIDNPVGAAGTEEDAEKRRTRLKERIRQLKKEGKRNFNKIVADEEGFSTQRLHQILNP